MNCGKPDLSVGMPGIPSCWFQWVSVSLWVLSLFEKE